MPNNFLVRQEVFIFMALVLATYTASFLLFLFLTPAPLANILGLLSLLCFSATTLPSILKTVFPSTKNSKTLRWFFKQRRRIGVAAFSFGLNHSVLLIIQNHLNLLDPKTCIHCFSGISLLSIFTLLATTSNNYSVKSLKANWNKLHQLAYLAIFILPWHILDKMQGHWSSLTPLAVLIPIVSLVLYLRRKWIEQIAVQGKQKAIGLNASRQES